MFRNNNIIEPFMENSKASVWWRNAAKTSRLFSLFYVIKRSALAFVKPIKLHYMQYNVSIQLKMLKSEKRRALDEVYCEKSNKKSMKQDRTFQDFSLFERGRRGRWRREAREGKRKVDLLQVVKKKKSPVVKEANTDKVMEVYSLLHLTEWTAGDRYMHTHTHTHLEGWWVKSISIRWKINSLLCCIVTFAN